MNIFRLEIGASFFLIPRTTISALHHHSFATHIHDLPAIPSHTTPSNPPYSPSPSLATEISLSPMTFSSPPSWPPFAVRFLRSLPIHFCIYHHNVRGLGKKACELFSHLHPDFPHVLCPTEHHLKYPQLNNAHIKNCNLGTYYCRQLCEEGAVAIFVLNSLCVSNIDIVKHF